MKITVNDKQYDLIIEQNALIQKGVVTDTPNTQRTQFGDMYREIIGTFYNYELTVERGRTMSLEDYDDLFMVLTNPNNKFNTITMPHNQGYITLQAYVSTVARALESIERGKHYWGAYVIEFIAKMPQIIPS